VVVAQVGRDLVASDDTQASAGDAGEFASTRPLACAVP
jgi:hypothetical protein